MLSGAARLQGEARARREKGQMFFQLFRKYTVMGFNHRIGLE